MTFIDSACAIFEHDGYRVLADPWLSNGAFEGSWYHFPVVRTKPRDVNNVDALYISHVHPDHFDLPTMRSFRRDIPIVVLDHGKNYLHKLLRNEGFGNLVTIPDRQTATLGPFRLTAYKPFATDVFHESKIGNVIDSSLVLEAATYSIFNGNDNNPTLEAAKELRQRHGQFTAALLKYNAASPYPACFMQLSEQQRLAEADRIKQRNLDHLVAVCDVLQPTYVMPFAGNFVLAGLQWRKNWFLGTTSWDDAARHIERRRPAQKTLVLREGQTFDFATETADGRYDPVDIVEQQRYIEEKLKDVRYPYESQSFDTADEQWLRAALPTARKNLWRVQQQFGFTMDYNVYVRAGNEFFRFSLADDGGEFVQRARGFERPYLSAEMDPRLLLNIVRRNAHWNNVEIGCHIDFFRDPDVYHPDVHVILSFLHVPVSAA